MNINFKILPVWIFWLLVFSTTSGLSAEPRKSESELIQMIYSGNPSKINDAMDRLPHWYPNGTNAFEIIRGILKSNCVPIIVQSDASHTQSILTLPNQHLTRMAARALGNYHATLDPDELNIIYGLLKSPDEETVMDGLKSLRGLNAPQAVDQILPLLQEDNPHVVRDSCRTLAVIGNTNTIPFIEPLLKNSRSDIKWDAQAAIKTLQSKP